MVQQVMAVYYIQQVHIAVAFKVRVEGKAEQAVITPVAYFLGYVDERLWPFFAVLHNPDFTGILPDVHALTVVRIR
jgi:hypothetical protein